MEWLADNYATILVLIALVVLCVFAIASIKKTNGKCSYCSHADTCPFAKLKKK